MGAYKKGEIKILANLVKPKVAILTGVNEQHLSLFGSMENLISAEGGKELVESLPDDGLVIVNSQNPILRNLAFEISKRKVLVSEEGFEDVSIKDLIVGKNFLSFEISLFSEGNSLKVNLPLIGRQNLQNLLLAICAAKNLKMTWQEIEGGLKKIKMDQGRILLKKGKNGVDILESTYSTNPSAVFSHLEHLKLWEGKRIIILPCLIELGEKAREIHFEIGKKIKEVCDFGILITRDYFEEVKSGAGDKVIFLDDKDKILERLEPFFEKNNVILVEGRIPKKILQILY
jgi:UDP-N-acetylmuramoyl-tripeptide--D-alanyl-D-alanine ligase